MKRKVDVTIRDITTTLDQINHVFDQTTENLHTQKWWVYGKCYFTYYRRNTHEFF